MLEKIRIVLVETSHSGNIGASARAMANMALSKLYLVNPQTPPDDHAHALAAHGNLLLQHAKIVPDLHDALDQVDFVIGTSARTRKMDLPMLSAEQAAKEILHHAEQGAEIAVIFGRERTGLYNDELLRCHKHAYIPTNDAYNSLNLAQAVQIFCYELYKQSQSLKNQPSIPQPKQIHDKASSREMDYFYRHLQDKMVQVGFLNPEKPGYVIEKLKRLFQRAQLESAEINILRGFLNAIDSEIEGNSDDHSRN